MSEQHKPTPETQAIVERASGFGIPQQQIARLMGISINTLRKYYEKELAVGSAKATLNIANALYSSAMSGNVAAQIFWMKARAGWSEKVRVEDVTETNKVRLAAIDYSKLTTEQLKALKAAEIKKEDMDE